MEQRSGIGRAREGLPIGKALLVLAIAALAGCGNPTETPGPVTCRPACLTAPPAACDGDTRISYDSFGTCVDGACEYPVRQTECELGCVDGACVEPGPCDGVVCDERPDDYCSGSEAVVHPEVGVCDETNGECRYEPTRTDCSDTDQFCREPEAGQALCVTIEPRCDDGLFNGDETDEDCGGEVCDGCPQEDACVLHRDCETEFCHENICTIPRCTDDEQNGTETDVDCGGDCPGCPPEGVCLGPDDCKSSICDEGFCTAASCDDRVQNQDESDVDCGGESCGSCGTGYSCSGHTDCEHLVCKRSVCADPSCFDRTQNGLESDRDCGGPECDACGPGQTCVENTDCTVLECGADGICPTHSCFDNEKNGDETAVDCGGPCDPCSVDDRCVTSADCESLVCRWVCIAPACDDNVQNGLETDVDCGGPRCPGCGGGKVCFEDRDCAVLVCNEDNRCARRSCFDGIRNGDETDADCGGDDCPPCADFDACEGDDDCQSSVCEEELCQYPVCDDDRQNGPEKGIDCGGGACDGCDAGTSCSLDVDCASLICDDVCIAGTCDDRILNQSEGDIDCGGSCDDCAIGRRCNENADCINDRCIEDRCTITCDDGINNGNETGLDCGGGDCPKCDLEQACTENEDCESNSCIGLTCEPASCTDGYQNGTETGQDCGGTCPDPCVVECSDAVAHLNLLDFEVTAGSWQHAGTGGAAPTIPDEVSRMSPWDYDCGEETSFGNGPEVVYRFEVPSDGTYLMSTDVTAADSLADTVVYVLPFECRTTVDAVACNEDIDAGNQLSTLSVELFAGEIVFIVVDTYSGADDIGLPYALEVVAQ